MTDPDLDPDPDPVEQENIAAAAIAGFTLAQFAFGELIKNGIVPRGDAEQAAGSRHFWTVHTPNSPCDWPVPAL
jgi:hypothetical protein